MTAREAKGVDKMADNVEIAARLLEYLQALRRSRTMVGIKGQPENIHHKNI
jgi:hypothetical protein